MPRVSSGCARSAPCCWRFVARPLSAVDLALWVTSKAHACEDALALLYAAFARAIAAHAVLDTATAHAALTEYERLVEHRVEADFALRLPLAVRLALETGDATLAERLAAHLELSLPLYRHSLASAGAAMAEARGEAAEAAAAFAAAASAWHRLRRALQKKRRRCSARGAAWRRSTERPRRQRRSARRARFSRGSRPCRRSPRPIGC